MCQTSASCLVLFRMKCFTSTLQNEQPGNEAARSGMGAVEARNNLGIRMILNRWGTCRYVAQTMNDFGYHKP